MNLTLKFNYMKAHEVKKQKLLCYYFLKASIMFVAFQLCMLGCIYAKESSRIEMDQQNVRKITGNVVDDRGETLIGINIKEKGTTNGTITDFDGNFELSVQDGDNVTLEFSYIGMKRQEIKLGNLSHILVTMESDIQDLEELVVVGYSTQTKVSVTGAISSVSTDELKMSSSSSLSNALAGRISGLTATQSIGGQPGKDDATLYLRGIGTTNSSAPLIMIDGVPRSNIRTIDPNEVESISVLKDASATAVFGVRGANGAILITTKRGKKGKPELSISAEQSYTSFTYEPERLSSVEYLNIRNEALCNDGSSALFSQDLIDKYKNPTAGLDPNDTDYEYKAMLRNYMYPNHDYYRESIKKHSPQTRVNANLSGGIDKLSYFVNASYIHQGGNLKTEKKSFLGYDPSSKMDRWSFRGNLDYKITNSLKAYLNIGTYIEKVNMPNPDRYPNSDQNWMMRDIMYQAVTILPITPGPVTLPGFGVEENGLIYPTYLDRSPFEIINRSGYLNETRSNLNSTFGMDFDLSNYITKGLSIKGMVSYDNISRTTLKGHKQERLYTIAVDTDNDTFSYAVSSPNEQRLSISRYANSNYYINLQGSINYSRLFGGHNVGGMFLVQRDNWEKDVADLPYNLIGLVGRVTYNYESRYFVEINMGYNGTEQFAPSKRYGFFPAGSIGWVISGEKFMNNTKNVLDFLKVRFSWGRVGNDKLGGTRFLYIDKLGMGGGPLGSLGLGQGINQGLRGNPNLTWETSDKVNYGIDFQLFSDLIGSFDFFTEKRTQILLQRQSIPAFQGIELGNIPKANIGKVDNYGYEIELNYNKAILSDLSISARGNFSYAKNMVKFFDEPIRDESYVHRYRTTDYSVGQQWGYKIDKKSNGGYWTSQEEIDNSSLKYSFGNPRPGDFKYVDMNGDNVIDERDQVPIGYSSVAPRINYGFNLGVNYKGFDFSIFFQGVGKYSSFMRDQNVYENIKQGTYYGYHKKAWTEDRWKGGDKITYPALSTETTTNHVANDFFIQDRSFVRLKNLELGYTLPKKTLKVIGVEKLRLYVSGQNLITWDKLKMSHLDPEKDDPIGYPITKLMSFGVNLTF